MKMKSGTMTEKQRRAVAALEAARRQGSSLTEYARAQGLAVRELYDALAALRRRGVLPKSGKRRLSNFVSVEVMESTVAAARTPESSDPLCRIVRTGYVIECLQWPPASWMATLNWGASDAAPRS
jgi:hypothetical protein